MTYRKRKSIRTAILALATAAILVPVAHGYPSYGPGTLSQSQSYSPQALKALTERYEKMAEAHQSIRPDDRAGVKGAGQTTVTSDYVDRQVANLEAKSSPGIHVDDRAGVRGPGPVETPALVHTHDGFDWTDAGIGASAMLFVAALIAAAMLARRRPGIAV